MKTMKIGRETFEIQKPVEKLDIPYFSNDTSEIFRAYGKPSQSKIEIWEEWVDWARQNNAHIEICSHSCMFFSISGYVEFEGKQYNLYITYAHNRIYPVQ